MKDSSASETLIMALPVLLVLLALIGAVIFFPQNSLLDIRGQAAPVTIAPTRIPLPTTTPSRSEAKIPRIPAGPESVCPDLYKPVCSTRTNITYTSECEARKANALPIKGGLCAAILPATN